MYEVNSKRNKNNKKKTEMNEWKKEEKCTFVRYVFF